MNNHKHPDERVSSIMGGTIDTPIGEIFVTYMKGEAVVSVSNGSRKNLDYELTDGDDGKELHIRTKTRRPSVGDEITQNGRTFEVNGVRPKENGKIQVMNDNGTWEDWLGE